MVLHIFGCDSRTFGKLVHTIQCFFKNPVDVIFVYLQTLHSYSSPELVSLWVMTRNVHLVLSYGSPYGSPFSF